MISESRKQERQVSLDERELEPPRIDPPDRVAVEDDEKEAIRSRALRHATPQVVEDLFSSALNGKSHAEIAKETDRSEQTVAKGLQRLRDRMRAERQASQDASGSNASADDGDSA